jgi:hypothetical protein
MPTKTYAVLIADVVESSSRAGLRSLLGKKLAAATARHVHEKRIALPYSVTAGDEFQTLTANLSSLPDLLLDLRTMFRPLSLRIGIGLGTISGRVAPPVNRLSGDAFRRARAAIESIKSGSRFKFPVLTAFESQDETFDATINLIYALQDTLVLKIKKKQWETMETFRRRETLRRTARQLELDISTVSRNLKRGTYWQLTETAKVVGNLLEQKFAQPHEEIQTG